MERTLLFLSALVVASTISCSGSGSGPILSQDASTSGSDGGAGADGSSSDGASAKDSGAFARCTRAPTIDSDCITEYGASASQAWSCTDVFFNPPPCKPLDKNGCTEVCSNRCCAP